MRLRPRRLLAALFACGLSLPAQESWRHEEVGLGVTLRTRHFAELHGARQFVAVLEIDPQATPRPRLRLARGEGRVPTSTLGQGSPAIAGVNGGFFNMQNGEPAGLLRIDGKTLRDDPGARYAILGIDRQEAVTILDPGRPAPVKLPHALAAGPLLVRDGKVAISKGFEKIAGRNPRTALGLTNSGRILLVTVDGRLPEAAGMSFDELARTLLDLGCAQALNLDGGGSTTLWVRGKPDRGVVNHPCDDKRFDAAGERAVSNAVLVEAADVLLDESAADGWQLPAQFAGTYELFGRWDQVPEQVRCRLGKAELTLAPKGAPHTWIRLGTLDAAADLSLLVDVPPPCLALRLVQRSWR